MRTFMAAALVAAALAGGTTGATAKTFRFAYSGDVATMDPYIPETFTQSFLHHIYEPLVRFTADLKIEPALAERWEVVEPTRVRFHLRKGVTFHEGGSFTARDVVVSLKRATHPDSPVKGNLPALQDVVAVDDHTVDLILTGPTPLLYNFLTNMFIFDAEWLEAHDAVKPVDSRKGETTYATTNTNGTGPFMLESRRPDAKTVLVVNPTWWDKPQHNIDRIEFTPIKSDATRVAALLSGELDLIYPSPLQDAARINASGTAKTLEAPGLRTIMFGLNVGAAELNASDVKGKNPLADIRVREAVYRAINMDLIQKKIMRGKSRNAGILVAPEIPGFDAAANERVPFDEGKAKALLAEAGYPNGLQIGMDCPNEAYVNDEEICQAMAAMLARVGIKANLTAQARSAHFAKVGKGQSDMFMVGWATLPMVDSYSVISAMLTKPEGSYGTWNPGRYSNPKIEEIARKVAVELDEPKRRAMMTEALTIAKNEFAWMALHQQPMSWAVRNGVNLKQSADDTVRIWTATVD